MTHDAAGAPSVGDQPLLDLLSSAETPLTYAQIAAELGTQLDDQVRANLSFHMHRLVRRGEATQVSRHDLRRWDIDLADHPPRSKFWARAGRSDLPIDPALSSGSAQELTALGVILEARVLASGQTKTQFLAEREIPHRTWWRLITPGQNVPRRSTVVKYAQLAGADVSEALEAAGYGEESGPALPLTPLGKVLEQARLTSHMEKHAFLAERGIDGREWRLLITRSRPRPLPQTVIKFAELVGADVAAALRAARYSPKLAEPGEQALPEKPVSSTRPSATVPLSPLGKVLERARRASRLKRQEFLAERDIDARVWYRLTAPGQERPLAQTVIKVARLAGADVAAALAAAGHNSKLAQRAVTGESPQNDGA